MNSITVRCAACGTKIGHTEERDNDAAPEVFVFAYRGGRRNPVLPDQVDSLAIAGDEGRHWKQHYGSIKCACPAKYDFADIAARVFDARRRGKSTIKVGIQPRPSTTH